jgi:hypothetical protein
MKYFFTIVVFLLAACSKKSASTPDQPAASITQVSVPSKSSDAPALAPNEVDYSKILDRLTQAVRKYAAETRAEPKSLNDLVTAGYLSELPEAPAGKKYVIDGNLRVQLQ